MSLIRTPAVVLLVLLAAAPAVAQEQKLSPEEKERFERNIKTAGNVGTGLLVAMVVGGLLVYPLPSAIALFHRHPNAVPVILVNLLLGWTLIGWVVALVWACTAIDRLRHR